LFLIFPLFALIVDPPSIQNIWSLRRASVSADSIHSHCFSWDFKVYSDFYDEFLGYAFVLRELSLDQWLPLSDVTSKCDLRRTVESEMPIDVGLISSLGSKLTRNFWSRKFNEKYGRV
jgi:hypothetical protein